MCPPPFYSKVEPDAYCACVESRAATPTLSCTVNNMGKKKKGGKQKGDKAGGGDKLPPPPNIEDQRPGAREALLTFKSVLPSLYSVQIMCISLSAKSTAIAVIKLHSQSFTPLFFLFFFCTVQNFRWCKTFR